MRVDLPEPDGPQTTTTSPRATSRLHSRRTWWVPYHLLTPSSRMTGPEPSGALTAAPRRLACSRATPREATNETAKYTTATNMYISTSRPSRCATWLAASRKSTSPTT